MNRLSIIATVASLACALAPEAGAATLYHVRCLDCAYHAAHGGLLAPTKINNLNVVVGNDIQSGQGYVLFGGMIAPTPVLPGYATSSANDINDAGHVVGSQVTSIDATEGYVWDGGTVTLLGALDGYPQSEAFAINSADQITGDSGVADEAAFVYQGGVMIEVPMVPPRFRWWGTGINAAGHVAGSSFSASAAPFPAAWIATDGTARWLAPRFTDTAANGINDQDQVVGSIDAYAAVWDSAGRRKLLNSVPGYAGGQALGINNNGVVVGELFADYDPQASPIAFVYDGSKVRNMNDLVLGGAASGWFLSEARSINDAGVIVGRGMLNHRPRAFVAVPVTR